jgi:hypothetical protein
VEHLEPTRLGSTWPVRTRYMASGSDAKAGGLTLRLAHELTHRLQ